MRQKGTLKYDIVIYLCLFVAFVCAIGSCIEPSSAVSEAPSKEVEKEPVVEEIEEPKHLLKVDKYSVAQKYLDSIVDQIITDNTITYDMVTTWSTYSIKNMTYKKEIMENYYRYEVEIKITGTNIIVPNEKVIVEKTEEYTVIKVLMNMFYSEGRNGYLIKSIDVPSEI